MSENRHQQQKFKRNIQITNSTITQLSQSINPHCPNSPRRYCNLIVLDGLVQTIVWGGGSKAPQQIKKRGNGNTHPTRDEVGISGEDTAFPVWICSGGVGDLTAGLEVEFCSPSPVAACGLDSASAAAEAEPAILVERWSRRSHAGAAGVEWSGAATCERARAIASVRGGRVRGTGVGEQEDEHISRFRLKHILGQIINL
ncbi:migration and invasion enhancer 1 [Striga asiatica]|uniref:Migration and invasion enhancer 1 n=1 Tax=Striga asiatica TaxID=4170 RepID=A0A5A7QLT8_STRAF|nr:migration and invasion enhancer 1 [Striga asiatica]